MTDPLKEAYDRTVKLAREDAERYRPPGAYWSNEEMEALTKRIEELEKHAHVHLAGSLTPIRVCK